MNKYSRYQDYVIKNGQFVGEFEKVYQDFEDPWEQTTREKFAIEKFIGILLLSKYNHKRPLEYGCGLGYYTQKLFETFACAGG